MARGRAGAPMRACAAGLCGRAGGSRQRPSRSIGARRSCITCARQCLQARGDYGAARDEYQLASDLDEAPLGRADRRSIDVIREHGERRPAHSSSISPGPWRSPPRTAWWATGVFYDHVHPTVAGHAEIAGVFAAALGAPNGDGSAARGRGDHRMPTPRSRTGSTARIRCCSSCSAGTTEPWRRSTKPAGSYPKLLPLRAAVEDVRAKDPVRSWDDFPEAAD